jgi:hypothetical protein
MTASSSRALQQLRRPFQRPAPPTDPPATRAGPHDPLRLCIYATIALLGWILGPVAALGFAVLGFAGYWGARRAGLKRSKCFLRDTRLVLAYLGLIALAGAGGIVWYVYFLLLA